MFRHKLFSLIIAASVAAPAFGQNSFPVVSLQGKPYYYYEVKKGDSLYGIAKANGWDETVLKELNPVVALELKKGARLYYPVQTSAEILPDAPAEQETGAVSGSSKAVSHKVEKGETVYSIARSYGVSTDLIYYQNPAARSGIKAGDVLKINPDDKTVEIVLYTVASGDTPYSVAKKFNCAVEDIYRENPGVNDRNFKAGSTVRVASNSNVSRIKKEQVTEKKLDSFMSYKVGSGESWNGIARKFGVEAESLRQLNADVELKKGALISVPKYENVEVTREYVAQDPREKTSEGRMEIFEDVQSSLMLTPGKVKVALLLAEPAGKRDLEFSRGFLTSVDCYKDADFDIDLEIIRGDREASEVISDLKRIEPNLIVVTADKDYPDYMADYADGSHAVVVNPFDLKNDAFRRNSSMVQLMPPSDMFNESVVKYISSHFPDRKIVVVGEASEDDMVATMLASEVDASRMLMLTSDELADYPFYETEKYLVYATPSKKSEVNALLDVVYEARQNSPLTEIAVVGRPSWITFADALKDNFHRNEVHIPSRFYFDMENADSKEFLSDYNRIFRHPPLKSYPVYAAVGYDVANWFLPLQAIGNGDLTSVPNNTSSPQLQIDFGLRRIDGGGFVNPVCYMVRYTPWQTVEKIKID